jgi:hypothetical protein
MQLSIDIVVAIAATIITIIISRRILEKSRFLKVRNTRTKLTAIVLGYRTGKKFPEQRKDYTMADFPDVQILSEGPDQYKKALLKYPTQILKPFKIGQVISVFWHGGELYYWHAYTRGLNRYLPPPWSFRNQRDENSEV